MLRDYLAGLAQTKLPLRTRIVLLLAAVEADSAPIAVAQRDLAMALQVPHHRRMQEALDELVTMRMAARLPGEGSRPATFRLLPPEEWLEPRWVGERKTCLVWVAYVRDRRAARKGLFAQQNSGALGPVLRRAKSGARTLASAPLWRAHNGTPSAPVYRAHNGTVSPAPSSSSAFPEQSEREISLSEGEQRLCEAFCAGAGLTFVTGRLLAGLREVAARANGSLGDICTAAADPAGPSRFLERLHLLRQLAEAPGAPDAGEPASEARRELRSQRSRLESLARALELSADPADREESLVVREQLATMDA